MKRKGQAALEFMTTYGWMFAVVIVVLGGLSYMGVLRPQNFISDSCEFSTSFVCGPFRIEEGVATYNLEISLTNNLQDDIQVEAIEVRLRDQPDYCRSTEVQPVGGGTNLSTSERVLRSRGENEFRFTLNQTAECDHLNAGLNIAGKQRYDVRLEYVLAQETLQLPQIAPGKIITTVQR